VPSLLPLLDDDDLRLRRAIAHLLAWFPRWAPSSLRLLRARLAAEPNLDAKATMLVALGLLAGGRGQTSHSPRLEALLGHGDAVVRWAAAVALARLLPQAPPEPAVAELLGWLTGATTAARRPAVLFPAPEQYALLVVRSVPALRERAVEAILERLATRPSLEAQPLVRNLKGLALQDLPDDPAAFPPLAKRVLGSLVWPLGRWN
jgi:hypothetical protein